MSPERPAGEWQMNPERTAGRELSVRMDSEQCAGLTQTRNSWSDGEVTALVNDLLRRVYKVIPTHLRARQRIRMGAAAIHLEVPPAHFYFASIKWSSVKYHPAPPV